LNSKLHAIAVGQGRPLIVLLSEGQMRDHKGAALMLNAQPPARGWSAKKAITATASAKLCALAA
jgi:hypothetical protein